MNGKENLWTAINLQNETQNNCLLLQSVRLKYCFWSYTLFCFIERVLEICQFYLAHAVRYSAASLYDTNTYSNLGANEKFYIFVADRLLTMVLDSFKHPCSERFVKGFVGTFLKK